MTAAPNSATPLEFARTAGASLLYAVRIYFWTFLIVTIVSSAANILSVAINMLILPLADGIRHLANRSHK